MSAVRVLLVDDHAVFRRGVAEVLAGERDFRIVGEATNGADALERARELVPDVILMDLSMPRMDGLEATRRIKAELPCVRVVVLTAGDASCSVYEAVRSGARGYVPKTIDPAALLGTLRAVARGGAALAPAMAARLLEGLAADPAMAASPTGSGLTPREHEALRLISRGTHARAIASTLGIVEDAVPSILQNILEKLYLENRIRAAASARDEAELRPAHA